jgi:hypothetical protein
MVTSSGLVCGLVQGRERASAVFCFEVRESVPNHSVKAVAKTEKLIPKAAPIGKEQFSLAILSPHLVDDTPDGELVVDIESHGSGLRFGGVGGQPFNLGITTGRNDKPHVVGHSFSRRMICEVQRMCSANHVSHSRLVARFAFEAGMVEGGLALLSQ